MPNTQGAFSIDLATGRLQVVEPAALDFETTPSFTLKVWACDSAESAHSATATITIDVRNADESPADETKKNRRKELERKLPVWGQIPPRLLFDRTLNYRTRRKHSLFVLSPEFHCLHIRFPFR